MYRLTNAAFTVSILLFRKMPSASELQSFDNDTVMIIVIKIELFISPLLDGRPYQINQNGVSPIPV